jgi:hypothetical protein
MHLLLARNLNNQNCRVFFVFSFVSSVSFVVQDLAFPLRPPRPLRLFVFFILSAFCWREGSCAWAALGSRLEARIATAIAFTPKEDLGFHRP